MWHVYRGVNYSLMEVYYGVSKDPEERVNGSHCVGGTKALTYWDCQIDDIRWTVVSQHSTQQAASARAHALEKLSLKGYDVIQTAGI